MEGNKLSKLSKLTAFVLIHSSVQSMENIDDQLRMQPKEHHNNQLSFTDIHKINLENLQSDLRRCEAVRRQFENNLLQVVPNPAE